MTETTLATRSLPTEFRYDGFSFKLLRRQGSIALFQKTASWSEDAFFEVVIVQFRAARTFPDGNSTPPREAMPHDEEWGEKAWSYSDLTPAKRKFNYLSDCPPKVYTKPKREL